MADMDGCVLGGGLMREVRMTCPRIAGLLLTFICILGCGDDPDVSTKDPCFPSAVTLGCQPIYEPTFENIHRQTLMTQCAIGGGACHLAAGRKGNLSLEGEDEAFHGLVRDGRVLPGEPECSPLVHRISGVHGAMMPPGSVLTKGEQCAISIWIEMGAEP
jgi:hypothetical protein